MKLIFFPIKNGLISILFGIIFVAQSVQPAFAQQNLGVPGAIKDVNGYLNQASKAATQQQRKLSDVINRADSLITNRINLLNALLTRIQNDSRLNSTEKSGLSSDVQTSINGLTSLKQKIDADTDVQTALTDAKQIFTNFRIYEEFEPKIRILIILNNLQTIILNVQALTPQLQNLINTLQSQGKDVSQLTPLLNDANSQLQTINSTLAADINTVQSLNSSTANYQTILTQVRGDIQNIIKTSFPKVRQDINQMRIIFKQLILPNNQPTTSVSITPGTTASPSGH